MLQYLFVFSVAESSAFKKGRRSRILKYTIAKLSETAIRARSTGHAED